MFACITPAAGEARGAGNRLSFGSGAEGIWQFKEGFCCSSSGRNHAGERWGKLLTFKKETGSRNEKNNQPDELLGAEEKASFVEGDSCGIRTSNQVHFKSHESNSARP